MEINADFTKIATEKTNELPWIPSPMKGVDRRMLDRIGGEVARATTIVRYAVGSAFSSHTHIGGEEFIVLEGVFQDEHGDYPAGTYVRNPIGTAHTPRSDDGCTIFVKLWQFRDDDKLQFAKNLDEVELFSVNDRFSSAVLFENEEEKVELQQWSKGIVELGSDGGVELLILDGGFEMNGTQYQKNDWVRLPDGKVVQANVTDAGVRFWMKSGHLSHVKVPNQK
ncbi:cupin [Sneathiella sp. P13V-1]|uniref:cupin domain-containing protein n=1 Tax=Sneathiella sp. P13V-1 TaxID=2697366 RepID=UPI00187B3108|nr:cupin domain-containing protein [Sneathiella sp. P13V-1]MBE7638289.1 cupin [Sneathiella sp. P13V-1]